MGAIAPSQPLPHVQHHSATTSVTPPRKHLRLLPFKLQTHQDKKKKKKAQMTKHFKAPEKIQLSEEEIANLSDAQFKTLVIKTLTELVESV